MPKTVTITEDKKTLPLNNQNQSVNASPYLSMIEQCFDKGQIDSIEKLMDLHDRWEAKHAKELFNQAMSKFQLMIPEIPKTKLAFNYKYAPLEDIIDFIKKPLNECGLSYTWNTDQTNGITVTCVIHHVGGHEVSNSLTSPPDNKQKTAVQQNMSTVTYLRRYTLTGALGIATADEDKEERLASSSKANDSDIDWSLEIQASNTVPELMTVYRKAQKSGDYESIKDQLTERKEAIQKAIQKKAAKKGEK